MKRIQRFMVGRHGADQLSAFLLIMSILAMWIGRMTGVSLFMLIGYLLMGIGFYRIFSKDMMSRRRENSEFLRRSIPVKNKLKHWVESIGGNTKQAHSHRYYVCTKCHKQLRVPQNKGKKVIKVVCPACRNQMKK
ncbi:hypothetical protein [Tindallia californiensis]|uniref:Zn-finger containing protein n=1 Tax=Tindallia californiensis TaxID=159292 RepID=A0A1H3LQA0_9FIRM|nr:hypothetical protein [Tindallia californiensis]SDY66506.1 hypothetical protein SAMN05192546_103315 [Tindallia californiensis]